MSNSENGKTADVLQGVSLAPAFTVDDVSESVRLYTEGLGFSIEDHMEDEEGVLRFAMLRGGQARIGLAQDDWAKGRNRVKGVGIRIWISTAQDVSELAERAEAAGFTIESPPGPLPWGPMAFSVVDPDGFKLTIANDA